MSQFERNIHPKIQKELNRRNQALENRSGDYSDLASRTTYAMMVTNYGRGSININKGISGGEFYEDVTIVSDIFTRQERIESYNGLIETLYGFRQDGKGSYRNTSSSGIKPVCGIKNVTLEFLNANGVRKGLVSWQAPSMESLEEFKDFLRVGTPVALQFGWVYRDIATETFITLDRENVAINVDQSILHNPYAKIINSNGNMDAVGGFVSNFSAKLRDDGGFDCSTEIMGMGISFLDDTGESKSGSEITMQLSEAVRNAILDTSIDKTYGDAVKKVSQVLTSSGFNLGSNSEEEKSLVQAIAFNDLHHAILNLDTICRETTYSEEANAVLEEDRKESLNGGDLEDDEACEDISYDSNDENRDYFNNEELIEFSTESSTEGIYNTETTDEKLFGGGYIEAKHNMFEITNVVLTTIQKRRTTSYGSISGGSETKTENSSDFYVRWGWFEDNILSKYLAVIDDEGRIIQDFRSVQRENGIIKTNYIAYNSNMIPSNFKDIFWASANWTLNEEDFKESKDKRIIKRLNNLNKTLSRTREFQDDVKPQYGRLRYMFVNVSLIQEAFGFSSSVRDTLDTSYFLKQKPTPPTIKNALQKIMTAMSESLYNIPRLIISSETTRMTIVDTVVEGLVNNKHYTNFENERYGLYKFPSFGKGSIVKNQQLEFNIPDKLGRAAFLNSGGNLAFKGNGEEEKFMKITAADGYPANSFMPLNIKYPKYGVEYGSERRKMKQLSEQYNYYGGLINLKDWKKIPLKSTPDKNDSTKLFTGPPPPETGLQTDIDGNLISVEFGKNPNGETITIEYTEDTFLGEVTHRTTKTKEGFWSTPANHANIFTLDKTPSNTWLESIQLQEKARTLLLTFFQNKGNKKTRIKSDPPMQWANLSLEIDGIGGLRPRSMLNASYLPKKYNKEVFDKDGNSLGPSFYFQITSLTQKIDDSGWTTSFDTLMRINDDAYDEAFESGAFNLNNSISSLGRQFDQFSPKSLHEKIKEIIKPLSAVKSKFDSFMSEAIADQVALEIEGTGSASPFTDRLQTWRKNRDDKELEKLEERLQISDSDLEILGLDNRVGNYTDVNWDQETAAFINENKAVGDLPIRDVSTDFSLSPEPVTLDSETANFIFQQNEFASNREYFNNPDNYEIDEKYKTKNVPATNLLDEEDPIVGEEQISGFQNTALADKMGLPPETYFTDIPPEATIVFDDGTAIDKQGPTTLEEQDAAEQIQQAEKVSLLAQIKGYIFKKSKKEVEQKQEPISLTATFKNTLIQEVNELLKRYGTGTKLEDVIGEVDTGLQSTLDEIRDFEARFDKFDNSEPEVNKYIYVVDSVKSERFRSANTPNRDSFRNRFNASIKTKLENEEIVSYSTGLVIGTTARGRAKSDNAFDSNLINSVQVAQFNLLKKVANINPPIPQEYS